MTTNGSLWNPVGTKNSLSNTQLNDIKSEVILIKNMFILTPKYTTFNSATDCGFTNSFESESTTGSNPIKYNSTITTNNIYKDGLTTTATVDLGTTYNYSSSNWILVKSGSNCGFVFKSSGLTAGKCLWVKLNKSPISANVNAYYILANPGSNVTTKELTISNVSVNYSTKTVSYTISTMMYPYLSTITEYKHFLCMVTGSGGSVTVSTIAVSTTNCTINMDTLPPGDYTIRYSMYDSAYISNVLPFGYYPPPTIDNVNFTNKMVTYKGSNLTIGNVTISNSTIPLTVISNTMGEFPINIPGGNYLLSFLINTTTINYTLPYFTVTTIDPTNSPQRSTITLSGINFLNISAVYFGNSSVEWTRESTTKLSVKVPVGSANCSIGIYDIYGNNASYASNFTYTNLKATTFTPKSAIQRSTITLSGINLSNISAVYFGNVSTAWTWNSSINLSVKVPVASFTNCSIGIYDIYGNNSSYDSTFTYMSFSATTFTPTGAPQRSTIALAGSNLSNISAVYFGNVSTAWIWNSSINLSVKVPVGSSNCSIGIYDIYGNNTSYDQTFTYTNLKSSVFEPKISVQRSTIELYGQNFSNISAVYFGNVSADWTWLSTTKLSVKVPVGSVNCSIGVWDIYGNNSSFNDTFTYLAMKATAFTPTSAPQRSTIALAGANLSNISAVYFGNVSATWTWKSSIELSATVPVGSANCSIGVWDVYGNNTSYDQTFIYTNLKATTFTPTSSPQRSTIALLGANLSNISAVYFGDVSASWTWNSSIQVFATVPVGAKGSIRIWDIYGNNDSYGPFTVTNLSYAFQVANMITLVGTGLTDVLLGLPLSYTSDKAPMFTGTLQGTVNVSKNGYYTDTVPIYPVNVIQSNPTSFAPDMVMVRGMPTGKIPDIFQVYR